MKLVKLNYLKVEFLIIIMIIMFIIYIYKTVRK